MDWLDLLIALGICAGLVKGLFDGFVKQLASFVSLILAILFAGNFASLLRGFLTSHSILTGIPPYVLTGVCYILAFSAIILLIYWLGTLLTVALNVTPAKWLNYLLGGIFGAIKWIFVLSLVFNLLAVFDPNSHLINKQTQENSVLYRGVRNVVPAIYPYIKNYFFNN